MVGILWGGPGPTKLLQGLQRQTSTPQQRTGDLEDVGHRVRSLSSPEKRSRAIRKGVSIGFPPLFPAAPRCCASRSWPEEAGRKGPLGPSFTLQGHSLRFGSTDLVKPSPQVGLCWGAGTRQYLPQEGQLDRRPFHSETGSENHGLPMGLPTTSSALMGSWKLLGMVGEGQARHSTEAKRMEASTNALVRPAGFFEH